MKMYPRDRESISNVVLQILVHKLVWLGSNKVVSLQSIITAETHPGVGQEAAQQICLIPAPKFSGGTSMYQGRLSFDSI